MTATKKILAFDLGAESGRGVLGLFDGSNLKLEVVHRFQNGVVRTLETLHWDILRLYNEMLTTLRLCATTYSGIDSLGVDTWGVDFALLGRGNNLLGNPRHYRDPHTEGIMEESFKRVSQADIFQYTGVQFMRFNTLFQLLALQRDRSPLLEMAETLLFIPDLFHFFFTGIKANEFTDASTSQMLNPRTKQWAQEMLARLGLPTKILGSLVSPGTVLGPLRNSVATDTGLMSTPVIAPASHDTASAVVAVPARGVSWAYISSGTWSLMGVELSSPLINEKVFQGNFTNEGGFAGTTRFLKNIMGLWLVQECRRIWEREGAPYTYDQLTRMASAARPNGSVVNPDDSSFWLPDSMPNALADFCARTGQPAPEGPGPIIRCALESLALRYRWVLERMEELLGRKLEVIHIVGGGSQNSLLCQLTADACNRRVIAGPIEATAIGNVLVQAIGLRLLGSLADAREVVERSFDVRTFSPQEPDKWHMPYQQFLKLLEPRA